METGFHTGGIRFRKKYTLLGGKSSPFSAFFRIIYDIEEKERTLMRPRFAWGSYPRALVSSLMFDSFLYREPRMAEFIENKAAICLLGPRAANGKDIG